MKSTRSSIIPQIQLPFAIAHSGGSRQRAGSQATRQPIAKMKHLKTGENNTKCIVSIIMGEHYLQHWNHYFKNSWVHYANRHQYDLLIIDQSILEKQQLTRAEVKFQKFKLLELEVLKTYERVVYLDSDILISERAPCIASTVPNGKIGMVSEFNLPYREWYDIARYYYDRPLTPMDYYRKHLLDDELENAEGVNDVFNGGVIVFGGQTLAPLLGSLFHKYKSGLPRKTAPTQHIDQPIFSCETVKNGVNLPLDARFNVIFRNWYALHYAFIDFEDRESMRKVVESTLLLVYFLHFTGMQGTEYIPDRFLDRA